MQLDSFSRRFMKNLRLLSAPLVLASAVISPAYATDYLQIEEAQKLVFPSAKEFKVAHVIFTDQQKKLIEERSGIQVSTKAQKIWEVLGEKHEKLGWFVVDYVIGKHSLIDYAVAIDTNKQVLDVEILSYRESYGGEIRSKNWRDQFKGKTLSNHLTLNDDITNIGGATLSSRHVTEGIKRILATLNVTQK